MDLVLSHVKEARILRHAAAELCIRLPVADTGCVLPLLDSLEAHQSELGISTLSLSLPNLVIMCQKRP